MPTHSTVLALLADRYQRLGQSECIRVLGAEGVTTLSWSELIEGAAASATSLQEAGVRRGEILPVMDATSAECIATFLGAILLGALPCMLAPPNRKIRAEVLSAKLLGMLGEKDFRHIAAPHSLHEFLREHLHSALPKVELLDIAGGEEADPEGYFARDCDPEEPAFLQHSSGTSGTPKAVVIGHGQVLQHLQVYGEHLGVSSKDRIASWLPLYHDMGMVACLWGGLIWGIPATHISNHKWILEPSLLLEDISDHKSTLVWLPNFAFKYLAKAIDEDQVDDYDLRSVRAWVNCSEPVTADAFHSFCQHFASAGITRESMSASYAMAENVFAVTQTSVGAAPKTIGVDRQALEAERRVQLSGEGSARTLVSSGSLIDGVELAIRTSEGDTDQADAVGEILILGPFALTEYHGNPEATAHALKDGWYHTGDIGFLHEGELFVIGRQKDVIIVGGRNLDPTEIELIASEVEGVIPGRVCCIGVYSEESGTEEVHLVVETKLPVEQHRDVLLACKRQVVADTEFQLRQVWCVEPGWLVKSTSGKIARNENAAKLASELLSV